MKRSIDLSLSSAVLTVPNVALTILLKFFCVTVNSTGDTINATVSTVNSVVDKVKSRVECQLQI